MLQRAEGGLELPTYADSVRPTGLPGFTNPQYSVEVGREGGEEVWGEGEGDTDDQPPPYSPGFGGGPRGGEIVTKINTLRKMFVGF